MSKTKQGDTVTPDSLREHEQDAANMKPDELLAEFWSFATNPLVNVAVDLVNSVGFDLISANITGELCGMVTSAVALRKAHGRNMTRKQIADDLGVEVPAEYTPTFALYLRAIRLRPDNAADRATAQRITAAIRGKIRKLVAQGDGA